MTWTTAARFLTDAEVGAVISVRPDTKWGMTGVLAGLAWENEGLVVLVTGFEYVPKAGLLPVARNFCLRDNERVGVDTLTASRIAARLKQTAGKDDA